MEIVESNIREEPILSSYIDISEKEDIKKQKKEEAIKELNALLEEGHQDIVNGRVVDSDYLKRKFPFLSGLNL